MKAIPKGVIEECESCGSIMKFRYSAFERFPFKNLCINQDMIMGCPVCHNTFISIFFYFLPSRWQRRLFKYWGYQRVPKNGGWAYKLPDKKPDNPKKPAVNIVTVLGNTRRNAFARCINAHWQKLWFADFAHLTAADLNRDNCFSFECDKCRYYAVVHFTVLPFSWQKKLVKRWGGRLRITKEWFGNVIEVIIPGREPFGYRQRRYASTSNGV